MLKTFTGKFERFIVTYAFAFFVLAGSIVMVKPHAVQAEGLSVGFAPVWWQYQESSGFRSAMPASTPLSSKVSGVSMGLDLGSDIQIGYGLHLNSSWTFILPAYQASESWTYSGNVQTNDFRAFESELKTSLIKDFEGWGTGLWISYLQHIQERQHFVVNGTPTAIYGEPIQETVQVVWAGLDFQADVAEHINTSLDVGLPISVRTTNSNSPGVVWGTYSGYRVGAKVSWDIAEQTGLENWTASLGYQYRQLGNEMLQQSNGATTLSYLWPKNTWQALSLNLSYTW